MSEQEIFEGEVSMSFLSMFKATLLLIIILHECTYFYILHNNFVNKIGGKMC